MSHRDTFSQSLQKYESSRAYLSPVARDWLLDFHIEKLFRFYDPVVRRRENFLPMITKSRRISKTNKRTPNLTIIVFMNFAMIFQLLGRRHASEWKDLYLMPCDFSLRCKTVSVHPRQGINDRPSRDSTQVLFGEAEMRALTYWALCDSGCISEKPTQHG